MTMLKTILLSLPQAVIKKIYSEEVSQVSNFLFINKQQTQWFFT